MRGGGGGEIRVYLNVQSGCIPLSFKWFYPVCGCTKKYRLMVLPFELYTVIYTSQRTQFIFITKNK